MKIVFQPAVALSILAASLCAGAADLAVLRNGNSIRHERRQVVGPITRLYLSDTASGYVEIPTDQIERFEPDTAPAPVPAKSQLPAAQSAKPQLTTPTTVTTRAIPALDLNPADLSKVISSAGERHQLDPDFINSVIRAESGFHTRAVSKKGAQGLMQLMPQTASQLGVTNSFDPNANVEGGTTYLRELLEKYDFDVVKALAAYNAGPRRVDQYRGVPPYYETQAYIARIIRDFNRQKLAENPALAQKTKTAHSSPSTKAVKSRSREPHVGPAGPLPQGAESASR